MPGPSNDVPRWQPPPERSEDVPRWQPPPAAPREAVPRWDPNAETASWQPDVGVLRWQPSATTPGARFDTEAPRRAPVVPPVSPFLLPFVWWGRHPWVAVWACVFLAPAGVVVLRVVDESGFAAYVQPLQWVLIGVFAVTLLRGVLFSAFRSITRLALGLVASLAATALLLWPVTQVTFGRVICPERAGPDLGVTVAAVAVQAWQRGDTGGAAWRGGAPSPEWLEKSRAIALIDHQLVDTGCFERVGPIDGTRTWHDFRVTIREGDRAPLSKVIIVNTAAATDGWKITSIEGPVP